MLFFGMETFFPSSLLFSELVMKNRAVVSNAPMNTKISWINSTTRFCLSNIFHCSDHCLPRNTRYKEKRFCLVQ